MRVLRGKVRERGKIGQRRRIHTQKTKKITIIDTQIRITTSTRRTIEVKPMFDGLADRRCMRVDPCQCPCSSEHVTQLICCCYAYEYLCRLKPITWVEGQCCYWQWVAEQRSKERLHERRRLKKKRALEGARRHSARPAWCVRTVRIARKDVNFEAPFGRLGSLSCRNSFLLEECLLRATIPVVNKDWAINLRGGRTLLNLPLLCLLGIFSVERQWRLDRLTFGRGFFGFGRSGSLS